MSFRFTCDLCDMGIGAGLVITKNCKHIFHQQCFLENHFKKTAPPNQCPCCENEIEELFLCMCNEGRKDPFHFATYKGSMLSASEWQTTKEKVEHWTYPKENLNGVKKASTVDNPAVSCLMCKHKIEIKFMIRTNCGHCFHLECFQRAYFLNPTKNCPKCRQETKELDLCFFEEMLGVWLWVTQYQSGITGESTWSRPRLPYDIATGKTKRPVNNEYQYVCFWERAYITDESSDSGFSHKSFDRCSSCDAFLLVDEEVLESTGNEFTKFVHVRCAGNINTASSSMFKYSGGLLSSRRSSNSCLSNNN